MNFKLWRPCAPRSVRDYRFLGLGCGFRSLGCTVMLILGFRFQGLGCSSLGVCAIWGLVGGVGVQG